MKNIKTLLLIGSILIASHARGIEWVHHPLPDTFRRAEPTGMASMNGYLFTIRNTSQGWKLYRSTDIYSGEPVGLSGQYVIRHKDRIYLLRWSPPDTIIIYHSTNGLQWETYQVPKDGIHDSGILRGVFSVGEHLYVVNSMGHVLRTSGEGASLQWEWIESLTAPDRNGNNRYFFSDYRGIVHVVLSAVVSDTESFHFIYRQNSDQTSWEKDPVAQLPWDETIMDPVILIEYNDELYLSASNLRKTKGLQIPFTDWQVVEHFGSGTHPRPYVINNQLFVWSIGNPIMRLSTSDVWKPVSVHTSIVDIFDMDSYNHAPAILKKKIYVNFTDESIWSLPLGVTGITNTSAPMKVIYADQKQAGVLGFSVEANFGDRAQFKVNNLGSAVLGQDIERVWLVPVTRTTEQPIQSNAIELHPDPQNPKRWVSDSPIQFNDGDEMAVMVDAAPTARPNETLIFSITPDDLVFENNSDFRLSGPLTGFSIELQVAAGAAGLNLSSDVLVFPQPARDEVRFLYDLTSVSDVLIRIYDQNGVLMTELSDPNKSIGQGQYTAWEARHIAPDLYFAIIKIKPATGDERILKKKVYIDR
jgi:hypothetical protein